jgi:GNAT superfamily N-acetyltransferase
MGDSASEATAEREPRIEFDAAPSLETRMALGREINDFHSRTVPHETRRFALLVRSDDAAPDAPLDAGLVATLSWGWLFIEALWVSEALRGQGMGRRLMRRAEAHARSQGCHAAWLDTFQARDFYIALGYAPFGMLDDYPPGQSRHFLKKSLVAETPAGAS